MVLLDRLGLYGEHAFTSPVFDPDPAVRSAAINRS
jgi:hypothetical protein